MSNQSENFNMAIDHFSSDQEETRAAAAFAAGNEFIFYLLDAPSLIAFQATSLSATSTNSSLPLSRLSRTIRRNGCWHSMPQKRQVFIITTCNVCQLIPCHLGRYSLLARSTGRRRGPSLGSSLREFPECRRIYTKCRSCLPWKIGHYPSFAIFAATSCTGTYYVSMYTRLH